MQQKIEGHDIECIRSEFRPAVEAGASKETLDNIRKRLREKYCPHLYSFRQVDAVCCQVIIQRNRLLTVTNCPPSEVVSKNNLENETTELKEISEQEVRQEDNDDEYVPSRESGDFANYQNDLKEKWRKTWQKYLIDHIPKLEDREKMRVLCLPGRECLEIPLYLEAGFNPRNIVGVEGGHSAAQKQFRETAAHYGIDVRTGRLEQLLLDEEKSFDVVSLDFHGTFSETILEILQRLPLKKRSHVMINLQGKREAEFAKIVMLSTCDNARQERNVIMEACSNLRTSLPPNGLHLQPASVGYNPYQFLVAEDKRQNEILEKCTATLQEARSEALLPLVVISAGRESKNNRAKALYKCIGDLLHNSVSSCLSDGKILTYIGAYEFLKSLHSWLEKHQSMEIIDKGAISNLIEYQVRSIPWLEDFRRYKYHSQTSKSRSPFYTMCFTSVKHEELIDSPTFQFFWEIWRASLKLIPKIRSDSEISGKIAISQDDGMYFSLQKGRNSEMARNFYSKYIKGLLPRPMRKKQNIFLSDSIYAKVGGEFTRSLCVSELVNDCAKMNDISSSHFDPLYDLKQKYIQSRWIEIE